MTSPDALLPDTFSRWQLPHTVPVDHALPVLATVDVVVIGAGAAGVAAATVAAEAGLSVIIVERYGFAGGAAVAGLSGTICGLYLASDDRDAAPTQIVFGFTERFRAALADRGGVTEPQRYGKTFTVAHDPFRWREVADDLMLRAGVRIMYHTAVSAVIVSHDQHHGVIVESNAGRVAIHASRTIDASGDAAVVSRAGGAYTFGDGGRIQNPTMFFRLGNVDTDRFWADFGDDTICSPELSAHIVAARTAGEDLPREKIWVFRTTRPGELLVNATRLTAPNGRMLNVIDPEDFTLAEIDGRRQVRSYASFFARTIDGCADSFVVDTGVEAGIRQTRSIRAVRTLTNADVLGCVSDPTGIARSPWPIEVHSGARPTLHWLIDNFYEVPYLTLVPERGENIIVAGRCLGAEHEALASARVTAQCFEYGAAAAVATVLSLTDDLPYRAVDGAHVRHELVRRGSAL